MKMMKSLKSRLGRAKWYILSVFLLVSLMGSLLQRCGTSNKFPSGTSSGGGTETAPVSGAPVLSPDADPILGLSAEIEDELLGHLDSDDLLSGSCEIDASKAFLFGLSSNDPCVGIWNLDDYAVNSPWKGPAELKGDEEALYLRLCGKNDAECAGSENKKATKLRLAVNMQNFSLINGPDSPGSCSDCGSSFAVAVVLEKNFSSDSQANYLLINKDGYAHALGPILGFSSDSNLVFGTKGKRGGNQISQKVDESSTSESNLDLVIAQFSRENGLFLNWNGCVKRDGLAKAASDNSSTHMPVMGFSNAGAGANLDLYALASFNAALSEDQLCTLARDLNEEFGLDLADPCGASTEGCID